VAGEFNGWDTRSLPMKKGNVQDWTAHIELSPGRYEYKYFEDGGWAEDAPGVEKAPNPFGTNNYVLYE